MEKQILFSKLNGFVHGGDYNPEQWLDRPDILEEDIRMMKKVGVNCVTLGVFSWSVYEPREGEFHFEWLKKIMDSLYENGIYTILATPSGARPAWLDKKYPEAMRVGKNGQRNHHGVRHNHCMSSPEYRKKTALMDKLLAEKFGQHYSLKFPEAADCLKVKLNGEDVGYLAGFPAKVEITDALLDGENHLEIKVDTTLVWKLKDGASTHLQLPATGITEAPVIETYI